MTSYMARTCVRHEDGTLRSPMNQDFIWPNQVGTIVTAPDWNPEPVCGGGLHGLRPGQQKPGHWVTGPDAVYLVCSFEEEDAVDLDGSVKVRQCRVECVGTAADYTNFLTELGYTGLYGAHIETSVGGHFFVGDDSIVVSDSASEISIFATRHATIICRGTGNAFVCGGACSHVEIENGSGHGGPSSTLICKGSEIGNCLWGGLDSTYFANKAFLIHQNGSEIDTHLIPSKVKSNALYRVVDGAFVEMST